MKEQGGKPAKAQDRRESAANHGAQGEGPSPHNVAKLAPIETVAVLPSFNGITGGGMQFLDLAGDGRPFRRRADRNVSVRVSHSQQQILFGNFRLDLVNECLWRDGQAIAVPPKEFAVLLYLVRNPGRLVTKEELIEAAWPETIVSDGVLKVSVRKIRAMLDDDSKAPQFIETAHRRGYRFIGRIIDGGKAERQRNIGTVGPVADSLHLSVPPPLPSSVSASSPLSLSGAYRLAALLPAMGLVGRETALAQMQGRLRRAMGGERQVVFVTGEAGIGKTTLVEAFLQSVKRDSTVWVGQGQCLEQYGAGEAYLPVLEAVSRLCQEPGRGGLVGVLRRHAPTWLRQMPWLVDEADRENLQRDVIGATSERMLREMAEALEALTADTPLALVLEDLHWSDYSTLDLASYLARRRKPARLLLVATYRPVEVALSEHPLKGVKQELQARRQCEELPLEYLNQEAVDEYLTRRFPQNEFPSAFAALLHERTEGNPLFLVNAVDYLQAEGLIAERDGQSRLTVALAELEVSAPENIRQMIEKQIERLDRGQQRVLEVAAVAGAEFLAAAIAVGLERGQTEVEEQCEELDRRRLFLRTTGVCSMPNGVVTTRYGFIHTLYQEVVYQRIATGRRMRLHQLIGRRIEEVYCERASEVAAELAMHEEGARLALELSDAHSYLLSQYYLAWGLLHQGRWGEMLRIVGEGGAGLEMAERNEHRRWAVLFRLELAWLHEQAFDFERARELCEEAHGQARKIGHPYTESLSLILLGTAHLGLGRRDAAFRCFSEVAARLGRERILMDWILRIPLHHGLSRYWLAQGEFARARREAESLYELASVPGERTYLALSLQTLAEIAMATQNWAGAEVAITRALTVIEGTEAPLAVWRVCAAAARLCEQLGRATEAADHWLRSAKTLNRLAGSLGDADQLRRSLGASPAAQIIGLSGA